MPVTIYLNATDFLRDAQPYLEKQEAANNLMLSICLRLQRYPERIKAAPYLATVHDEKGLIVATVMTPPPPHKLLLYADQEECQEAARMVLHDLLDHGWTVPGVFGPTRVAEQFAAAWAAISGKSAKPGMFQRVYELRKVNHPQYSPGSMRVVTEADLPLITEWAYQFTLDCFGSADQAEAAELAQRRVGDRDVYLWEDGQPVSMAAKARPTINGITVNLVYTPPQFRRRGYATSCVARLSQLLLDSGWKFCTLFTDLANPTSNDIYQKVGYTPVCDFNEYIF